MTDVHDNTTEKPEPTTVTDDDSNLRDDPKKFESEVEKAVAARLKDLKAKVDTAYSQRDLSIKEVEELKQKLSEQETAKLKAEGKEIEALELELSQERAKAETLAKRNIELTRDLEIKSILNGYDFRSDKASKMAFSEITGQLLQTETGSWQGRNGDKVEKIITDFMTSEDNEFLLKPKANSGSGNTTPASQKTQSSTTKGSLFERTQEEVLQMAAEGKFRK